MYLFLLKNTFLSIIYHLNPNYLRAIKMQLDQTTYFVQLNAALELGSRACKVYDEQCVEDEESSLKMFET